nr:AAA family ATPase [Pararoseomonas baculiformis]
MTSLTLRRYGPFEEAALSFDPAPGRINLVLAPNGAGKSVLRHAFGELLFGIGGQTPMGFRHGYAGMQLSATGLAPDGSPFAFTRRKGLRNTLTGPDDAPLDQAWMDRLLGRADAKLLSQLFALDTERLRQGGRDLLSSGGALADALLAASGGLREASALRRGLEEERDRLAPQRRTATRPFYAALDRWSDSRKTLRQALVRPQEWAERERELREAEAARDAANGAAAEAGEALRRLERVRRTRPHLLRHAAALAWLEAHPEAPHLPPDLAARLPAARGAVALAAHGVDTARAALAQLDAEIAGVVTDDALLGRAEEIAALSSTVGLVKQAQEGLPEAEAALAAARDRVAAGLSALGQQQDADPAALLPSPGLLSELRRLMAEDAGQEAALAGLARRAAEGAIRLAEADAALAALPPPADARRLEELLAEIRRGGDPVAGLAAARRGVSEADARLAAALVGLPVGLRDPAVLAALDPPSTGALERLSGARDAAELALNRADEALRRAAAALLATRRERAALLAGGAPPTREALAEARARREAGWDLIFRRLSGETAGATERAYAGDRPLPLAYAEAVSEADSLADARWADAERAATAERLTRVLSEQETELSTAAAAREAALKARDAAQERWGAAVRPLGKAEDSTLAEVQSALSAREAGLAAAQGLATARAFLDELRARQEGAAARLCQAVGEVASPDLPLLLDRAEERVRQHRAAEGERRAREGAAAAARDLLRDVEGERAEASARRARWEREWDAALERLGVAPGTSPGTLEERLLAYDALGEAARELSSLEAQAGAWRASVERFGAGYAALCGALGLTPDPEPVAGLRALDRRQRAEAALAERRAALLDGRERDVEALREGEAALSGAEAGLRAVLAAAGAATPEQAEARIALGSERARQDALRVAAEEELLAGGDGLPLEVLRAEAEAVPSGELEAALSQAEAARERHAGEAQDQVAAVTRLELEMRQVSGDDVALRAAADEAAAAGLLGRTLEDALLLQVAAGLLDAALGAVQEGADDALLRRISTAFSTLTGGTYAGVASQEDERGTARLTLRSRAFPEEETGVDGLSEGTRDALFLALRLVAIEDQAAAGTVLPFLGDDILQSFDDGRAAAAFRALLELSGTAQVILLSHHEHLVPVLRAAVPTSAIHLQRLAS